MIMMVQSGSMVSVHWAYEVTSIAGQLQQSAGQRMRWPPPDRGRTLINIKVRGRMLGDVCLSVTSI